MGLTVHVSALRIRLEALKKCYPSATAACLEDWLLDVANRRGARIVVRNPPTPENFNPPPPESFTQEELVAAICQLQGQDRPHLLRLAAQLISRGQLDFMVLARVARRERVETVLHEMAAEALKVSPSHPGWTFLAQTFASVPRARDVVIHWTRLSEPVMAHGRVNASGWRLVA